MPDSGLRRRLSGADAESVIGGRRDLYGRGGDGLAVEHLDDLEAVTFDITVVGNQGGEIDHQLFIDLADEGGTRAEAGDAIIMDAR